MNDLDIVMPVHNIAKRGLNRVYLSCISLLQQKQHFNYIWVINSSINIEYNGLEQLIGKLPQINHIQIKQKEFSKPALLNCGIKLSDSQWIFCTDADYLFRRDLLEVCARERDDSTLLLKHVKMLPKLNIDENRVEKWDFPQCKFNRFGDLADGAMQYTTRDWFMKVGGYDERMVGLCGMDNDLHARAKRDKLDIKWVHDSEILHMDHPIDVKMKTSNQAVRNWKIRDKDKTIVRQTSLND